MARTFVKIEPGNFVAWVRNGEVEGRIMDADFMETTGGMTIVGWWAEKPTRDKFIEEMEMMGHCGAINFWDRP